MAVPAAAKADAAKAGILNLKAEAQKPWTVTVRTNSPRIECLGADYSEAYTATVDIAGVHKQNRTVSVDQIKTAALKTLTDNGFSVREKAEITVKDGKITIPLQRPKEIIPGQARGVLCAVNPLR